MDASKHILHEIESINYQASEYISGKESINYEDFKEHYRDFKSMLFQYTDADEKTKKLIHLMPTLGNEKTLFILIAAALLLITGFILLPLLYFFVGAFIVAAAAFAARFIITNNRKTRLTEIINLNNSICQRINLQIVKSDTTSTGGCASE